MLKVLMLCWCCAVGAAHAAEAETWIVALDRWGNNSYQTLTLREDGARLEGDLDGDKLSGSRQGASIEFSAVGEDGARYLYRATLDGAAMRGSADFPDTNNPKARAQHAFTARRLPQRPPARRAAMTSSHPTTPTCSAPTGRRC